MNLSISEDTMLDGVDQKKKIVSLGKGNLGKIKDRLCYPKFKVSSFFTENLG